MSIVAKIGRFSALLIITFCGFSLWARSTHFDLKREFPNYLLPIEYRGLPSSSVPEAVLKARRELLEAALASVFRRLEVPLFINGKYVSTPYFEYLHKELKSIDSTIEVVPSGGVVRSAISYIYNEIYRTIAKDTGLNPETVLQKIISDPRAIPAHEVRGVGSDFDALFYRYNSKNFRALSKLATEITNSAETTAGMRYSRNVSKRAFFTISDFKDYNEQISRSTSQGGSDIDFLAFDLVKGQFILPPAVEGAPDYQSIVNNLLCGLYRYLPANGVVEDSAKQTVRGFRPLLELPFMRLIDDHQLRKEISELKALTPKAKEQFDKLLRNARFAGAHNRIYRAESPSLENDILKLVMSSARKRDENPLIPEFVDELPLGRESDIPRELLTGIDDFIQKNTDRGVLYHGTPDVGRGLAIMRKGLFVSGGFNEQGLYAYDRGGYTSSRRQVAAGRAGKTGMVFRLPVKRDTRIRILIWDRVKDHSWIKKISQQYPDRNLFEVLAREYGVDIIVNGHVLIQNTAVLEMNTSLEDLLQGISDSLNGAGYNNALDIEVGMQTLAEFKSISAIQSAMSSRPVEWPDTKTLAIALRDQIQSGNSTKPKADLDFLAEILDHADDGASLAIEEEKLRAIARTLQTKFLASGSNQDLNRALLYLVALEDFKDFSAREFKELAGPLIVEAHAQSLSTKYYNNDALSQAIEVARRHKISFNEFKPLFDSRIKALNPNTNAFEIMINKKSTIGGARIPVISEFYDQTLLRQYILNLVAKTYDTASEKYYRYSGKTLVTLDYKTLSVLRNIAPSFPEEVNDFLSVLGRHGDYVSEKIRASLKLPEVNGSKSDKTKRFEGYLRDNQLMSEYPWLHKNLIAEYVLTATEWSADLLPAIVAYYHKERDKKWQSVEPEVWKILIWIFKSNKSEQADKTYLKHTLIDFMKSQQRAPMIEAGWKEIESSRGRFPLWAEFSDDELVSFLIGSKPNNNFIRELYNEAFVAALARPSLKGKLASKACKESRCLEWFDIGTWQMLMRIIKSGFEAKEDINLIKSLFWDSRILTSNETTISEGWKEITGPPRRFSLWEHFKQDELVGFINNFKPTSTFTKQLYYDALKNALERSSLAGLQIKKLKDNLDLEKLILSLSPRHPHFSLLLSYGSYIRGNEVVLLEALKMHLPDPDLFYRIADEVFLTTPSRNPLRNWISEHLGEMKDVPVRIFESLMRSSPSEKEIVMVFAKQQNLDFDFLRSYIVGKAFNWDSRAAKNVLIQQRHMTTQVAESILDRFPQINYEDKVVFLRKMIIMPTWSDRMHKTMDSLSNDIALISWAKSLHTKNSCERTLISKEAS